MKCLDTHKDNIMQYNIEKYGFTYCGIIYLASGDARLAYQKYAIAIPHRGLSPYEHIIY